MPIVMENKNIVKRAYIVTFIGCSLSFLEKKTHPQKMPSVGKINDT